MDPLAAPVTVGANVAVSIFDVPLANVKDVDTAANENPVPEMDTLETVTDALPVLLMITVLDLPKVGLRSEEASQSLARIWDQFGAVLV